MKKIPIAVFDRYVWLFKDVDELNTVLKKSDREPTTNDVYGEVFSETVGQRTITMIFINKDKCDKSNQPYLLERTVAHECLHASISVYDNMGAEMKSALEEPIAYLMDYLVGKTMEYVNA